MPIFIDESGDTGSTTTSSTYFRLVAFWLPSEFVDAANCAISEARKHFGLKQSYEFKYAWSYRHPEHRDFIFQAIDSIPYCFTTGSINKSFFSKPLTAREIFQQTIRDIARPFQTHFESIESMKRASENQRFQLLEIVKVDQNDDAEFLSIVKAEFSSLIRQDRTKRPFVKKVRFEHSSSEPLIQISDLICGLLSDTNADPSLKSVVQKHGIS